jgi:hypothetical protein
MALQHPVTDARPSLDANLRRRPRFKEHPRFFFPDGTVIFLVRYP